GRVEPGHWHRHDRARSAAGRREDRRRHDPEAGIVRARPARRRAARPRARRAHPPRVAARVLHPGGHRNDGAAMTSFHDIQPLDALHGGGGKVFFANSGAEANECAIKLARRYGQANGGPDRFHVLSAWGSFHGRTLTTLAATGQPQKQETFQPLPVGFRQVVFGELDALAAAMDGRVCAVMLEPVQGEGGVQPSPPGYLEGVRALCDEREALFIVDEVQTGLGRTGKWFGYQHADGVRPDIVTMAKALGNGVPIGACWARTEVAEAFKPGD